MRLNTKNAVPATTTTADVDANPATVVLPVAATSAYPPVPFLATVERGAPTAELVRVTAMTFNSMTVERGFDGVPIHAHLSGSVVEHTTAALLFEEANLHVNDTGRDDHCFSEDTEILTEVGWLGIDDIESGVAAWSFDLETERAVLDPIEAVWRYSTNDFPEMISLHTQDLGEVLVTPQHSMVWRRANAKRQKAWARRTAESLPQQFSLPASAIGHDHQSVFSDDQIALLAWATTEGHVCADGAVSISQKNGLTADRIRGLLDRLGFAYSEYKQSGDMRAFRLRSGFLSWAMDDDKVPRWDLTSMSSRQATIFVAEAVLGDGSVSGGRKLEQIMEWLDGGRQPSMTLGAKSDRYIDFVQALCVLNGFKSRDYIDPDGFHRLAIKSTREHSFACGASPTAAVDRVATFGTRVWCVTVPLHHTVIARRPGSAPFICGNTQYLDQDRHTAIDHSDLLHVPRSVASMAHDPTPDDGQLEFESDTFLLRYADTNGRFLVSAPNVRTVNFVPSSNGISFGSGQQSFSALTIPDFVKAMDDSQLRFEIRGAGKLTSTYGFGTPAGVLVKVGIRVGSTFYEGGRIPLSVVGQHIPILGSMQLGGPASVLGPSNPAIEAGLHAFTMYFNITFSGTGAGFSVDSNDGWSLVITEVFPINLLTVS